MPAKSRKPGKKKKKKEVDVSITPLRALAFLAVVLLAFYTIKYLQTTTSLPEAPEAGEAGEANYVDLGDVVSVDYTGRFKGNNSVFDTSIEDVAKKEGVYEEWRIYDPLKLIIGQSDLLPGFEEALIGMRVGEEKTVEISPEDGYGEYDPTKIVFVNRTQQIPKVIPIDYAAFREAFETDPVVGEYYETVDSLWPLKVLNVSGGMVYAEQEAEVGITFAGMFGEAVIVEITDESILVREDPTPGDWVYSTYGPSKVLDFNETEVVIDLNHPLAGENLVFTIYLRDLMKG